MKKLFVTVALALFSFAAFSQAPPPEKTFTVKLTEGQINALLTLINDAPIPGADRRAFDKLIRDQAVAQLPKQDSTAPKQPPVKDKPKDEKKN